MKKEPVQGSTFHFAGSRLYSCGGVPVEVDGGVVVELPPVVRVQRIRRAVGVFGAAIGVFGAALGDDGVVSGVVAGEFGVTSRSRLSRARSCGGRSGRCVWCSGSVHCSGRSRLTAHRAALGSGSGHPSCPTAFPCCRLCWHPASPSYLHRRCLRPHQRLLPPQLLRLPELSPSIRTTALYLLIESVSASLCPSHPLSKVAEMAAPYPMGFEAYGDALD